MIGFETFGHGNEPVIIIHDWFCDSSSYDHCRPYLDTSTFTYTFMDLRGYGRSKDMSGTFTVEEAAQDIIALADHLGWDTFHLVGHSMSGMIVQYAALKNSERIKSVVAITPTPPCGMQPPEEVFDFLMDAARTNDDAAHLGVHMMTSNRLSDSFADFKVKKWRKTTIEEARAGYLNMFSTTDFSEDVKGFARPMLIVVGQFDVEGHTEEDAKNTFLTWYPHAKIEPMASGHYPMQEVPPYFVSTMESFMKQHI